MTVFEFEVYTFFNQSGNQDQNIHKYYTRETFESIRKSQDKQKNMYAGNKYLSYISNDTNHFYKLNKIIPHPKKSLKASLIRLASELGHSGSEFK